MEPASHHDGMIIIEWLNQDVTLKVWQWYLVLAIVVGVVLVVGYYG